MKDKDFGKNWQDEQREKMVRIQFPETIKRIERKAEERGREKVLGRIKEMFEKSIPHGLYSPSETSFLYEKFGSAIQQYYIEETSKSKIS